MRSIDSRVSKEVYDALSELLHRHRLGRQRFSVDAAQSALGIYGRNSPRAGVAVQVVPAFSEAFDQQRALRRLHEIKR